MTDQRTLVERLRGIASGDLMQKATETRDTIRAAADAIEQAEARIAVLNDALTFTQEHLKQALDEKQPLVELWEWRAHVAEARLAKAERLADAVHEVCWTEAFDWENGEIGVGTRFRQHLIPALAAFRNTEDAK